MFEIISFVDKYKSHIKKKILDKIKKPYVCVNLADNIKQDFIVPFVIISYLNYYFITILISL